MNPEAIARLEARDTATIASRTFAYTQFKDYSCRSSISDGAL
jgi:hypothetical protein